MRHLVILSTANLDRETGMSTLNRRLTDTMPAHMRLGITLQTDEEHAVFNKV